MTADSLRPTAAPGETFRQEEPIYAHLAKVWHSTGRSVPGEPDLEWRRLTRGPGVRPFPAPREGQPLFGKHRRGQGGQES